MYKQIDSNKRKTFLLITLFLIFIIGLGWAFSYALDEYWILPAAVIFSVVQVLIAYYYSDAITLLISRAKEVKHDDSPELYHILENLCITSGLPMPRLFIIDDSAPNAFATGRDPKHAAIAVTTGLLQKLNKTELEGVIAHELSHIKNYDIRLMTIVVVLVGIVALMSDWFLRWTWHGRSRRDRGEAKLEAILMLVGVILAILSPLVAILIQLSISRKREFLADADGALLTRYPEGLASALEKISADPEPLEVANKATAHLYIVNPFKDQERISWFANLFSTHPPIEERVRALRAML